jgi:raffinose/stachyose/melibiose transport system permease protein
MTIKKSDIIKFIFLTISACVILIPFLALFLGGFKSLGELRTNPFGMPQIWEWANYKEIIFTKSSVTRSTTVWQLLYNSFVISFFTIFLTLVTASMAAFAFSHIRFFGSRMIFNYFLMGMMFPIATAILPLFITVRDLGLLDTYIGVIVPQVAFGLALSILLFKIFFEQIPKELFEAAFVEGCGYLRFFWQFILPLSTPIIATVGVFALVNSWNNYIVPLIMLNDESMFTWTLGIMQYRGQYQTQWNKVLAYMTITIIPAVTFFVLAQKYIVAGLTAGSVKG